MTDHLIIAREALNVQADALHVLAERIGTEFQQAVELMLNCKGRVVICGMGKSGLIGKKIMATLASTGTPSFYLHPGEAFHGDLGMLKAIDVVVLISYSGETEEVIKLIPSLKAFGNVIIAMTGDIASTLAKHADVVLDISVKREVCPNNLAPTTSTLTTMAMGDALAVSLIKARNFQPADFARYHPGGSLGRKLLTKVEDVMHTSLPVVKPDSGFQECIFTMTSSRLGLALVMEGNRLTGLVTDGDLRRALTSMPDAMAQPVSAFMTTRPHTIDRQAQMSEAESYMHSHKIRALVVTDSKTGNVVGIVEIFG